MIAVLTTCLQALSPYMFCVHTCINTRGKTLLWWSHPVCMFVPALSTAVRLIALKNADTARVQNTFWYRLLPWCKNLFLILYSNGKNIHLYLCNNKYKNISSYQLNCSLRLECIYHESYFQQQCISRVSQSVQGPLQHFSTTRRHNISENVVLFLSLTE